MKKESLAEIAARIDAHLRRFERDPKINLYRLEKGGDEVPADDPRTHGGRVGTGRFYKAGAFARKGATRVYVVYVGYQGTVALTRTEALAYLAYLDAGHDGRHWEQQREAEGK